VILILSTKDDTHAELVSKKLADRYASHLWFDPAEFPANAQVSVSLGSLDRPRFVLEYDGKTIDLQNITAIWDRRPGIPAAAADVTNQKVREWVSEESQALLEGIWATLDCLYVPGVEQHRYAAENKLIQLVQASRLGFSVPRTSISNSPACLLNTFSLFDGTAVTKAVSNPVVWRDDEEWAIFTRPIQRRDIGYFRTIRFAPVTMQEYVPKLLEIRVTVVGSQVFAAAIHSQVSHRTRHDWRHYDYEKTLHEPHRLPEGISKLCIELVRVFNLCFGAIDMVLTPKGDYVFLEINQNGQWAWIEELTGMPISDAIAELLVSGARP
jgi:hypothetical protein